MSNVVSLMERKEKWSLASEQGSLRVYFSNHGRIRVEIDGVQQTVSFFDSVQLLDELNRNFSQVVCGVYKEDHQY